MATEAQTTETIISPEIPFVTLKPGDCACGSEKKAKDCCDPILTGKRTAATAEELLRARYTAFTQEKVDFILGSHHPRTQDQVSREEIADWAKSSEWQGLRILKRTGGAPTDEQASLIFHARYVNGGKLHEHYEQSEFEKFEGQWKFVDAIGLSPGPIRRTEPKIGRNDPCSCGSGKKFKKCHGAAA